VGAKDGFHVLPNSGANQILALEEDDDGNLWAGHTRSTERPTPLSVRPAGTLRLEPVPLPQMQAPGSVTSLCADGRTLWLGTSGGGLLRATRSNRSFTAVEAVRIGAWPKDASVTRVRKDPDGGLWIAGTHGVAQWNGKAWATLGKGEGLPEDHALSIAPVGGGEAWVCFNDAMALCRLRRREGGLEIVQRILPPHPVLEQPLMGLLPGPDGALWMGSSGGLLRWDGKRVLRFGKDAGFPGEDCCQNALAFDAQGGLWAGVSMGLVHAPLPPGRFEPGPPPALITEAARADGTSLLEAKGEREVPWKFRTVAFAYCPSGSRNTEGLAYQVRLVGLEDQWRETAQPESRFPGLAPGSYRFEVRTVSSTGDLGEPASLDFRVLAPWWLRPWAWALGILVFATGVVHLFRWRTRVLRQRNAHLEELVRERTHALEEASLVDPLTELRNRRYLEVAVPDDAIRAQRSFREALTQGADPRDEKEALAFIILDLDHFKRVNDQWGHPAGDAVLVQLAGILRSVTRASDTLIRWGGEEFLIVVKRVRQTDGPILAQNLLDAVRAHSFRLPNGDRIDMTCSLGMVPFPLHPEAPDLGSWRIAIEVADQCLYAAKRSGRDRWVACRVRAGAPVEPFAHLDAWDVPWALAHGVMDAESSAPDFRWPELPSGARANA
jgi:diguanylate cyclase (GGDEF)-like protein